MSVLPVNPPFVSLDGRFSIALPRQVHGFAALSPKQLGTNATGMSFKWSFEKSELNAVFIDLPETETKGSAEELKEIFARAKNDILKYFPAGKAMEEKASVFDGHPVMSARFELAENTYGILRLYLVQNRMYRLTAIFQNAENTKFVDRAFDTFRLISRAEADAEMQKKFEAMKPPALPQNPVAAKEKTDAEDENLKGKVKKIVQESEDLSGTWSKQDRKPSSVTYFDENGNFTERHLYDSQGNPFQITMYGYIDGKRVSNSRTANYEYNPPPAAAAPKTKTEEPSQKLDPRYEYAFEYKYKDGKLVEKQMFFSSGKKGMRYVYNYSGNQIESLVYTTEGELNQKYLATLDEDGSVIEQINFGLSNYKYYGDRKYRYAYEFDEKGNWVKRTTFTEVTENGTKTFKPSSVSYRTITYF